MNIKVGDTLVIHCYKHNGVIYESSKVAYVLDIKDEYIVLGDGLQSVPYEAFSGCSALKSILLSGMPPAWTRSKRM